jgi:hypothetical protein
MWRSNLSGAKERSKSKTTKNNKLNISSGGPGNQRILPVSKSMFKKIMALRNCKLIAISQMMDIYLGNLV